MNERTSLVQKGETSPELASQIEVVTPAVDIFENDNELLLYADMPGASKENITVNIDNGKLFLSGLRKQKTAGAAQWEEFGDVEYRRVFSVPQTIDVSKVNAELKDGVLRLHLPKSETAKPRQIEIKAA